MIDLGEAEHYAYSRQFESGCGITRTIELTLTHAQGDTVRATGTVGWSNVPETCEFTNFSTSDCSTTADFSYALKQECSEPCQVVELFRESLDEPQDLACDCN